MINELFKFTKWPVDKAFEEYSTKFEPFWVRNCLECNQSAIFKELNDCSDQIDISCAEGDEEFNGNPIYREKIDVTVSFFLDCFKAVDEEKTHWLLDSGLKMYFSQCSLFSCDPKDPPQLESLAPFFPSPPFIPSADITKINLWINIQPAVSTLHYDAYNNVLCVHKGSKEVLLISPKHSTILAPLMASFESPNHSKLSTKEITDLIESSIKSDYYKVTLNAGDCLFIPEGWWHLITSAQCTIAVNYWFDSGITKFLQSAPHMKSYLLRNVLHSLTEDAVDAIDNPPLSTEINYSNKKQRIEDVNSVYSKSLTDEQFQSFMETIYTSASLSNSQSSSSSSSSHHNAECIQLVSTDIGYMIKYWLPYSVKEAKKWTAIFLSLTPEAMHKLITYWDCLSASPYFITDGIGFVDQAMITNFFDSIFVPCGDKATEVRRYMITQNDAWISQYAVKIVDKLLLGK